MKKTIYQVDQTGMLSGEGFRPLSDAASETSDLCRDSENHRP